VTDASAKSVENLGAVQGDQEMATESNVQIKPTDNNDNNNSGAETPPPAETQKQGVEKGQPPSEDLEMGDAAGAAATHTEGNSNEGYITEDIKDTIMGVLIPEKDPNRRGAPDKIKKGQPTQSSPLGTRNKK
jgi:hypothetical protein